MKLPTNLEEAILELKNIMSDEDFNDFIKQPEYKVVTWHNDLGRWIRNNWKLWEGGPLADSLKKIGLQHPDDMSGTILTSAHRFYNNVRLDVEDQVRYYQQYWAASEQKL